MKEYQYLIGKIIVAMAIIVAAIIIAQAIGGAGESIRSGLLQLGDEKSVPLEKVCGKIYIREVYKSIFVEVKSV